MEINGKTSDGYHTFDELYYRRMILFSVICNQNKRNSWKSKKHFDDKKDPMYDGYFIVGIETPLGQYSYHYKKEYWHLFDVKEIPNAPEWDGHMSINDWKMQEEIQNESRRITDSNMYDIKSQKKIEKDKKDQKLVDWIKSYYPSLSKQDIQDIITKSKSMLLQKISKDINQ